MEPLTEFWRQKGVDLNLGSVAYQLRDSEQGTNLSVPRVLHTENEANESTDLTGLCVRLKEMVARGRGRAARAF